MLDDTTNSVPSPTQITDQKTSLEEVEKDLEQSAQITKDQIHQDQAMARSLATTPSLQDTVVDIEKDLLDEIVKRLDKEQITAEQAQNLAGEFLALLPINDQKDLLEKLRNLSQTDPMAQGIFLDYIKSSEEDETSQKLDLMSKHLHQGKIEEALAVAKGGTNGS